jgi:hypothetical protein
MEERSVREGRRDGSSSKREEEGRLKRRGREGSKQRGRRNR